MSSALFTQPVNPVTASGRTTSIPLQIARPATSGSFEREQRFSVPVQMNPVGDQSTVRLSDIFTDIQTGVYEEEVENDFVLDASENVIFEMAGAPLSDQGNNIAQESVVLGNIESTPRASAAASTRNPRRRLVKKVSSLDANNIAGAAYYKAAKRNGRMLARLEAQKLQAETFKMQQEAAFWQQKRLNLIADREAAGQRNVPVPNIVNIPVDHSLLVPVSELFPSDSDDNDRKFHNFGIFLIFLILFNLNV